MQLDRYRELAHFLRTRRERITPEQVGLPSGGRRRTPGLRRGEVAMLAEVGLDWYTYLEQGRHINVSRDVLERVADVLMLDATERKHLFFLAHKQLPLERRQDSPKVGPALQRFLDGLGDSPACVMDTKMNIVAWNSAYCALNGDYSVKSEQERNFVWLTFTSSQFRYLKGEQWEMHARRIVAQFHACYARYTDDPWWSKQYEALSKVSSEFREFWETHDVREAIDAHKALNCPNLGVLNFDHISFQSLENPNLTVSIHIPHQDGTIEKMRQLMSGNKVDILIAGK
ncbi:Helix-turn-helix domain-containing protein [Paenibacillus algorifonticola]|uniref:Helix-turn-helix domain-containing protein n=1 Tax=Paenibacillus algorifonticola TaxID=684063 RepID=A0A1I2HVK5_9BACL|nr:helix-turn-helix transcriptional regulator [Paenibacillus algorifonticola]SFF33443.1 Helix-turn-helix domain-containing protein [Paenibacillus algorifonticola]